MKGIFLKKCHELHYKTTLISLQAQFRYHNVHDFNALTAKD